MDMDKIFEAFVNVQTILICLAIYVMTFVIRKVVEGAWKDAKEHRLWREVWLPIGPIVNGAALGLMAKTFVWPVVVHNSLSGRIMYGAICGVFSALVYSRIRSWAQSAPAKKGGKLLAPSPTAGASVPPMTSDAPPADEAETPKVGGVGNDDGK